jgi:valyl-tRNA synthetase
VQGKLANPKFVDKAPADVVAKEKNRQLELQSAAERLQQQLQALNKL